MTYYGENTSVSDSIHFPDKISPPMSRPVTQKFPSSDKIHKKIVNVQILSLNVPDVEEYETEFIFKKKSQDFYNDFTVKLTNLHDILFASARVGFYKFVKNKKKPLGACKIYFKEFYTAESGKEIISELPILNTLEIEKADYYNAEWNIIGTVTFKFTHEDREDLLDEKEQETFVKNVFNMAMKPHRTEVFFKLFDLLTNVRQGSFLCNFWAVVGCLPADYYYSFLYGKCHTLDCDGTNCKKEFCHKGYSSITPKFSQENYFHLQEAAASFAEHFSVKYLASIRTRSDIHNKKYRAILERLNVNDGDIIEYFEGDDIVCGYVIYYKRPTPDSKPDTIAISFRGTASGNDTLTDLDSYYVEFQDGYTHAGFKKIADYFMVNEFTQLYAIAQKKKIKNIFLTGHSLGAAVSILVHLRILQHYDLTVSSVTFGCPPVVSENIAARENLNISMFAYDTDIITRLSYGSILDLKYFCISISSLVRIISSPEKLTERIDEIRNHIKKHNSNPKLYHPGKLYHIKKFDEDDINQNDNTNINSITNINSTISDTVNSVASTESIVSTDLHSSSSDISEKPPSNEMIVAKMGYGDFYKMKRVHYSFFDEIIFSRNSGWGHFLHNTANAFIYAFEEESEQ